MQTGSACVLLPSHALGKYIKGSGLDVLTIESEIYSSTTLCQTFAGNTFMHGIAYHAMNSLACYYIKCSKYLM